MINAFNWKTYYFTKLPYNKINIYLLQDGTYDKL